MRMWRHLVGGRRLLFIVGRVPVLLDRMGSAVTANGRPTPFWATHPRRALQ
jgi:hypothetical protein